MYDAFLPKQKPPFYRGLPQKYKPMKKENYAFRFRIFLAGGSNFFGWSLAKSGTG